MNLVCNSAKSEKTGYPYLRKSARAPLRLALVSGIIGLSLSFIVDMGRLTF